MFYAHRTLPNLTARIHSPYSYILCVSEAKMAARSPPTPPPRVTATGVDSSGPIGRAQTGIDFYPRMGDGWAYLEVYTPRSQSSDKDLDPVCAHYSEDFDDFRHALGVKLRCHFRTPMFLVCMPADAVQQRQRQVRSSSACSSSNNEAAASSSRGRSVSSVSSASIVRVRSCSLVSRGLVCPEDVFQCPCKPRVGVILVDHEQTGQCQCSAGCDSSGPGSTLASHLALTNAF